MSALDVVSSLPGSTTSVLMVTASRWTLVGTGSGACRPRYGEEMLAQGDPTGLSSTTGQLVMLFGLLAALAVLIRWWWQQRGR